MIIRLTYFVLFILMILSLYLGGKGIKQHNRFLIIIAILAFSLNEGLRFGRWIDYNNFVVYYPDYINKNYDNADFLFVFFCRLIDLMGGNHQGMVFFMSFMHIFAAVYFIRLFRNVAMFALPFYGLFTYNVAENLMRWNLGFAFILMGLYHLFKCPKEIKDYLLVVLFFITALNVHLGLLLILPLFCFLYIINRPIAPPWLSTVLYFLIVFTFQMDYMESVAEYANLFSFMGDHFMGYAENAERWLTKSALGLESTRSFPSLPLLLVYFLCLWSGYKMIPITGKLYLFSYNAFLVGFLLNPIALKVEILNRVDYLFVIFSAFVLTFIVKYRILIHNFTSKLIPMVSVFILLNYARSELSIPFRRKTDQLLYVWDKKNKEYLDNEEVYFKDMYNSSNVK